MFTTEGHPLPIDAVRQQEQEPLQQYQPSKPGNATLMTLHTHPYYRRVSLLLCTLLFPGFAHRSALGTATSAEIAPL